MAEEDLPEVDDAFIRGFEVASGNRDEFVALVKQYMKDEFEARSRADVQRQIATHLLQRNPLSVPAALVDQEIEEMRAEAGAATAAPPSRTVAEDRARINLINATIIREQGIKVDHGRVRARIDEMAVGEPDADAFRNRYFQNPSLLAGIEAQVLNEQVVDWLLSKAAVTDMPSSFRSLKDL